LDEIGGGASYFRQGGGIAISRNQQLREMPSLRSRRIGRLKPGKQLDGVRTRCTVLSFRAGSHGAAMWRRTV